MRRIYPSLALVQPRKSRPCLTERLLMGRKESNQTNNQIIVFKYANLILWIKKYILGRIGLHFGGFGKKLK